MTRVMTVSGPIPPDRLGFTLPHEHTAMAALDLASRTAGWELLPDDDVVLDELRDFRRRGGGSIVDLTLDGIGRDPHRLRRLASSSGVNVIMGTGWLRGSTYPDEVLVDRRSVDDLAAIIVDELEHGVAGTGIRPGIIGEIGTDASWITAREERVHRAAARAAARTGLAITTHSAGSAVGLAQLRLFTEEGVDPGRVVIGHADTYPVLDHYLEVLDAGANLQFDRLGHRSGVEESREPRLVEIIVELLERGHASQILLSQDVSHDRHLKAYGGLGYVYLQQHFLPTLRTAAVGEGEIGQMTVDNPARILAIA